MTYYHHKTWHRQSSHHAWQRPLRTFFSCKNINLPWLTKINSKVTRLKAALYLICRVNVELSKMMCGCVSCRSATEAHQSKHTFAFSLDKCTLVLRLFPQTLAVGYHTHKHSHDILSTKNSNVRPTSWLQCGLNMVFLLGHFLVFLL